MAAKKTETTSLNEMKTKMIEIRLAIKAHQEKNTNAHKSLRKQIAQLLTRSETKSISGGKITIK